MWGTHVWALLVFCSIEQQLPLEGNAQALDRSLSLWLITLRQMNVFFYNVEQKKTPDVTTEHTSVKTVFKLSFFFQRSKSPESFPPCCNRCGLVFRFVSATMATEVLCLNCEWVCLNICLLNSVYPLTCLTTSCFFGAFLCFARENNTETLRLLFITVTVYFFFKKRPFVFVHKFPLFWSMRCCFHLVLKSILSDLTTSRPLEARVPTWR